MARLLKTEPTHCDSALQLSKEELFLSEAHLFSSPHKHSQHSGVQQQPLALHLDIQLKSETLTVAPGHTVTFQGWNDGNAGNRDRAEARGLVGISQESLVSAFLQQVVLN